MHKTVTALLLLNFVLAVVILDAHGYWGADFDHKIVGQGINQLLQGHFGAGQPSGRGNNLSFDDLQPGDILLGGNDGATYGRFTHAAIYQGEGVALQGWLTTGVDTVMISNFRNYDRSCILRVKTSYSRRLTALQYAAEQKGRLFYPLSFKSGERIWNCTKLIWISYKKQGIDLDSGHDIWVTPDNIYRSPMVTVVAKSGDV